MASTDARAFPTKNTAYRVTFPIFDADGDLVTGATGLDSEISKDGGTFADCTNEATEIATSSGMYYLDLTSTEMNADTVAIIVKTSTSGAKTTPMVFYPATLSVAQLGVNTVQVGGTVQTARDIGASVLLSSGTGTGQISLSSGAVLLQATQTGVTIPTVTTLTNLPAITSNWLTAAGIAASALNGKGDWNIGKTGYALTATTGLGNQTSNITGNLSGSVGSVTGAVGSVTGAVGSVTAGVTVTTNNDKTGYALSTAGIQAIWDILTSALTTVGSIGKLIVDYLDAAISSRSIYSGVDTAGTTTLLSRIIGTLATGTHNPQSGDTYALANGASGFVAIKADTAAILVDTGTTLDAALAVVDGNVDAIKAKTDQFVFTVANQVDANALSGGGGLDAAGVRSAVGLASANLDTQLSGIQSDTDDIQTRIPAALVSGRMDASVGAMAANTLTASALATDAVTEIQSGLATGADLATVDGNVDAILTDTNELQTDWVNGGRLDLILDARASQTSVDDLPTNAELAVALAAADDAILAAIAALTIPTAAANADAVWDEVLSGHLTAGSTGAALNAAGAAGDPWSTTIPGAYGAGTAGKIVGDNLNATVSSRSTQTSVDDLPTNAELATALASADDAILAAIALLNNLSQADVRTAVGLGSANLDTQLADLPTNAELAAALASADDAILAAIAALNNLSSAQVTAAVPTAIQNADALLKRDFSAVTGEASRSALNALRFIRNKFSTTATPGSVTVYKEDDATAAYTKSLTTDPAAEPIVEG